MQKNTLGNMRLDRVSALKPEPNLYLIELIHAIKVIHNASNGLMELRYSVEIQIMSNRGFIEYLGYGKYRITRKLENLFETE